MAFSFTGIAFLFGFFATGLLSYRFFRHWQKEKTIVSRLFFYLGALFSLTIFICAIAGLFFSSNAQILRLAVIAAAFVQSFIFSIAAFLASYIKFPRFSPWYAGITFLLFGLIATILTAAIPFQPYIDASGGINWDIQFLPNLFRSSLMMVTIVPIIAILIQQFIRSGEKLAKTKAFGLMLVFIFTALIALFDFFLISVLKLGAIVSNIALIITSVVIFVITFFTRQDQPYEDATKF